MRGLIYSVLMLFSTVTFSQEVRNAPITNNSTVPASVMEEEQTFGKEKVDSVVVIQESTYKKSRKKSETSKGAVVNMEGNAQGATSINSQQQLQVASKGFSYSKSKATTQRTQRSPSQLQQQQMNEAVDYFETYAPNSFEFHFFSYQAGNYDISKFEHLKKAEEIRPDNVDVHIQMAAYYIITEDKINALIYFEKLIDANKITPEILDYAENVLLSSPEKGALFTHGFDDSYAVWYVQNKNKVREDVKLISLDFLQSKTYRQVLIDAGYVFPSDDVVDVSFLSEVCKINTDKKISISLTTPKEYFEPIKNQLYVTGLVFEYHENEFNNFYRNDDLWSNTFERNSIIEASEDKAKKLSANYLPMLLFLRKFYKMSGEVDKMNTVDEALDKIGVQCNKYDQVQKIKGAY